VFFGYITPNYIESMLVGYHCRVFRTDKWSTGEDICKTFGTVFSFHQDSSSSLQVPADPDRARGGSVSSATSRDSAIGPRTSSSRENLTAHESSSSLFSSSYDATQDHVLSRVRGSSTHSAGSAGSTTLPSTAFTDNPFLPKHRRTYSEDSMLMDSPPLDLPKAPGPLPSQSAGPILVVSEPGEEGEFVRSQSQSQYLVEQTGQNLYRRLQRLRRPLLKDHRVKQKTYRSCFNARDVVDWLMDQEDFAEPEGAVEFMQELLKADIIRGVPGDHAEFLYESMLFRFKGEGGIRSRSSSRSKVGGPTRVIFAQAGRQTGRQTGS